MNATYHIQWFGLLSERRGLTSEIVRSSARSPMELYAELAELHGVSLQIQNLRAAINDAFVPWNHPLEEGDRVAFLPPMSGG